MEQGDRGGCEAGRRAPRGGAARSRWSPLARAGAWAAACAFGLALHAAALAAGEPARLAELTGQLSGTDHELRLELLADGSARARYALADPDRAVDHRPLDYRGRWSASPLDVRLTATEPPPPGLAEVAKLLLRAEPAGEGLAAKYKLDDGGSWRTVRALSFQAGALADLVAADAASAREAAAEPRGDAEAIAEPLPGSFRAAYAVEVDDVYVRVADGRLLGSMRLSNHGERALVAVSVEVEVIGGGEGPPPRRRVRIAGPLEPTERVRRIDVDLGEAPKEPLSRRGEARARAVALDPIARGADAAEVAPGDAPRALRLRGRSMAELTRGLEILFAWPSGEDRYHILLRNRGGDELTGIELDAYYLDARGLTLEALPIGLERPLAAGEVRLLADVAPTPRGGAAERYFLTHLDKVDVRVGRAYPRPQDAAPRFGGAAERVYEDLVIRNLEISGDRNVPVFRFDLLHQGERAFARVGLAVAGQDARGRVLAIAPALTATARADEPALKPGEERALWLRGETIYGIRDAVLTWTVIVCDLELEAL